MPKPFLELTLDAFTAALEQFPFTRRVDAVHLHHTFRPNHLQFRQNPPIEAIEGMWRFHTMPEPRGRGFADIAQHATLDPRGMLWTGRDWNRAPASATGFNGNGAVGPFMIEMIGDFDQGQDPFGDEQKRVAIEAVAAIQRRFGLAPEAIRFHREMSTKTCPGTSIDRDALIEEIRVAHGAPRSRAAVMTGSPFAPSESEAFAAARRAIAALTSGIARDDALTVETELDEEAMTAGHAAASAGLATDDVTRDAPSTAARADRPFAPEDEELLREHVVNLRFGALSNDGAFTTTPEDVDRLFNECIPGFLARTGQARLDLAIYAHGGLIGELDGLRNVLAKAKFWTANGIYPIFFVWETGLRETISGLVRGLVGARAAARGVDDAADLVIEAAASSVGLEVWSFMKRSAEVAAVAGGGALLVAEKIADLWQQRHDAMRIHAVGHSAGAIFHAHFVQCLLAQKVQAPVPPIRVSTLQFLAPAITSALFKKRLSPRLEPGKGIESFVEYTMRRSFERDDTAGPYRKSLLYLVRNAFEPQRPTPILGLEDSINEDPDLMLLFGLAGARKRGELVFSPTPDGASKRHASRSVRHGDFDDDPSTMNSVFRRILDVPDAQSIVDFPDMRKKLSPFDPVPVPAPVPATSVAAATPIRATARPAAGQRRALCVGVNDYPGRHALAGCVHDADAWAATLRALHFDVSILRDQQATREGLVLGLRRLLTGAQAGDVLAFQFAGHGTRVRDIDGDEPDSQDEALCPIDFLDGALLIDDDLSELFSSLPDGVNLTCFIDCCHSGSVTRVVEIGGATGGRPVNARARFIPPNAALDEAHARFRAERSTRATDASTVVGVLFSACQDHEVAYEENGAGDFTRHALAVLSGGFDGLSHAEFVARVKARFGSPPRQSPNLYPINDATAAGALLQPVVATGGSGDAANSDREMLDRLEAIERRLGQLGV